MHNVKQFKGVKETRIYTPDILAKSITHYTGNDYKNILDVCSGDFDLSKYYNGKITGIDIKQPNNPENAEGKTFIQGSFFDTEFKDNFDLIVCNPPFNGAPKKKLFPELFLNEILNKFPDTPIVLITPIGITFNQRIKSKRWREMAELNINSSLVLPLDIFSNDERPILIHTQVLFINFKNWKHNGVLFLKEDLAAA